MKEKPGEKKVEGERIVCRAKRSSRCYDGRLSSPLYGGGGMAEDGTFDGASVICDACYIAAGMPGVGPGGDPGTLLGGRGRGGV